MRKIGLCILIFVTTLSFASTEQKGFGKELYNQDCIRCHGEYGEKVAFGRTRIIKDLTHDEFTFVLKGYRDKSYGGQMKYFMTHYVQSLDDQQIESIFVYLTTYK